MTPKKSRSGKSPPPSPLLLLARRLRLIAPVWGLIETQLGDDFLQRGESRRIALRWRVPKGKPPERDFVGKVWRGLGPLPVSWRWMPHVKRSADAVIADVAAGILYALAADPAAPLAGRVEDHAGRVASEEEIERAREWMRAQGIQGGLV